MPGFFYARICGDSHGCVRTGGSGDCWTSALATRGFKVIMDLDVPAVHDDTTFYTRLKDDLIRCQIDSDRHFPWTMFHHGDKELRIVCREEDDALWLKLHI